MAAGRDGFLLTERKNSPKDQKRESAQREAEKAARRFLLEAETQQVRHHTWYSTYLAARLSSRIHTYTPYITLSIMSQPP